MEELKWIIYAIHGREDNCVNSFGSWVLGIFFNSGSSWDDKLFGIIHDFGIKRLENEKPAKTFEVPIGCPFTEGLG